MERIQKLFPHFITALLNSYTQIFFSNNKVFGVIVMVVSFFDFWAGLTGLVAVLVSNIAAYTIGFNRFNIRSGYYGFNSLLVGLGIGVYYEPGMELFLVIAFAALLTLFITISLEGVIGKYGLPYLSVPFLIGLWLVTLSSRQFQQLEISERGVYSLNEMYLIGGVTMVHIYEWFNNLNLPLTLTIYFRSLGAIFFQYHLFPGILIAIGLLYYSRIAFLLSLLGFYSAYAYYTFIGANFGELTYGYIGFNFILTSIAIGGFFVISSPYSFLWVILLTPLTSFFISGTSTIMNTWQLSIYSLPFNLIVLMFLYTLKFRERFFLKPEMVLFQQYSPEKNLYNQVNNSNRFKNAQYLQIYLPFFGEWSVTQAHSGEHTHKGDWRHAWDFEIADENGRYFKNDGSKPEDFYCFAKPVLAPADGYVVEVIDYLEDNGIGDMDIQNNWGNTIVIKHLEGLYTKLSHLKKDSCKIKVGDYVKKGDTIALVGNSGRSPLPHLHFQVQATPYIGSKTLDYPIANYILHHGRIFNFQAYDRPVKGEIVSNVQKNDTLIKAFNLIPGQRMHMEIQEKHGAKKQVYDWEIQSDIYNYTYIYCEQTKSKAYFHNNGNVFYFTRFDGNKKSLLFAFYMANFKILKGFYKDMQIVDSFPPGELNNVLALTLQDFFAPFVLFLKTNFNLEYRKIEDDFGKSEITLKSSADTRIGKWVLQRLEFETEIKNDRFDRIIITTKNKKLEVREIGSN
jgi:urea transporter/murein DD-endopeptidase MepM/ murein hydrolase activator NlpD